MNILMKRFVSACVLGAAMMGAATAWSGVTKKLYINYSTTSAATYADGTPVSTNEWFVLVWTAPGKTIDLSKDITGDENSFLGDDWNWLTKKHAEANGTCKATNYSSTSNRYESGTVQLYLLDTRISDTECAPLGTNIYGKTFPTVINAVVPIEGATCTCSFGYQYTTISGPAPATSAWTILSKEVPVPVLVSMVFTNGVATVGATNTVSTANYCLKGSLDVTFTNTVWSCASQKGADDVTTTLYFSDTDATNSAAFYRIEVVK